MKSWLETVKKVLFNPDKFFKKMKTKGGYGDPVAFAAINLLIGGLLAGLLTFNILFALSSVLLAVVGGVVGLFIAAFIYHIIVLIFGGKGKYEATFRVGAYSSVVSLFSWIPFVNILAGFYSLYLYTLGFSYVHKMSKGKAFIVVILPIIIIWIIVAILLSLGFASVLGGLAGYGLAQ